MKKLFAFVLAFVLAAALLAGCTAGQASSQPPAATTAPGSAPADDGGERELVEVTVFRGTDMAQGYSDTLYVDYIKDKFNLLLKYEYVPASAEAEKLNLAFATDEYADIIEVSAVDPMLQRYAPDGFLIPVSDHLDKLPDYRSAFEDDEWEMMTDTYSLADGKLYFMPQRMAATSTSSNVWMYRLDEFEKANIPLPKTTDEFLDAMRKLKQINPDLTIPNRWGLANALEGFNIAFRTAYDMYFDMDSNQIEYGPATDKFRDLLIYMNTLYSEGILHNEFVTMTAEQRTAEFTKGNVYANFQFAGAEGSLNSWQEEAGLPADWAWDTDYLLLTAYPDKQPMYQKYALYMAYAIALTDKLEGERLDRVLEYMNWSASEEGQLFHEYGIEGQHYEVVDGVPVSLPTGGPDGETYQTTIYNFGPFGYYLIQNEAGMEAMYPNASIVNEATKDYDPMLYAKIPLRLTEDEETTLNETAVVLNQTRDEWLQAFILGTKDVNDDGQWTAFIEAMNKAGLEDYVKIQREANARL